MSERTVYIIGHDNPVEVGEDLYKIGICSDIGERMKVLRPGTPYKLKLITTIEPKPAARIVEHRLHALFLSQRYRREWFRLYPRQINALRKQDTLSEQELRTAADVIREWDRSVSTVKLSDVFEEVRSRL